MRRIERNERDTFMLTGTPLDLTPFGSVLTAIGLLYWVVGALLLWWTVRGAHTFNLKVGLGLLVIAIFAAGPGLSAYRRAQAQHAAQARFAAAKARFDMRCKEAGEIINRTVDGVEGVMMMNLRQENVDPRDQFKLNDPYGSNCGGKSCIASYLFSYTMVPTAHGSWKPYTSRVYQFVDFVDADGQRYRYTKDSANGPLKRSVTSKPAPRYGVVWADISTRADRELWIAGGSIKVVDLAIGEVIAERKGYLMDPGQGNLGGGRIPWSWAGAYGPSCPSLAGHNVTFVSKIINPVMRLQP
jgi:hypothetical protein